jgi:hypothetical protein
MKHITKYKLHASSAVLSGVVIILLELMIHPHREHRKLEGLLDIVHTVCTESFEV